MQATIIVMHSRHFNMSETKTWPFSIFLFLKHRIFLVLFPENWLQSAWSSQTTTTNKPFFLFVYRLLRLDLINLLVILAFVRFLFSFLLGSVCMTTATPQSYKIETSDRNNLDTIEGRQGIRTYILQHLVVI